MSSSAPVFRALAVAACLALSPSRIDAAAPPARAGAPAANAAYGSALPRFARFGWVSPPRTFENAARYAELAGAGFNVTVLAWDDTGTVAENHLRLDLARPLGLECLLVDNDLDSLSLSKPASLAFADTIVARYQSDPAFLGWYLGDEPPASYFPRLGEWFSILRPRDPAHPAWNSLGPRGAFPTRAAFETYVQQYVDATHPAVLCNNQYDFTTTGDAGKLTENIASLGAIARAQGIPFWGVVQLVEHWIFRHVTDGMLRWQVGQWLAWGAHGIGYFTYWTPAPDSAYHWQPAMIEWGTGARTPYYDLVKALDARLAPLGNTLAGMTWVATEHAGSVPPGGVPFAPDTVLAAVSGRATIGEFADSLGVAHVFVVNADSLAARTITLSLAAGRRASRLRDDGSGWDTLAVGAGGTVPLTLAPGDFVLLRVPTLRDLLVVEPPGAAPLRLAFAPNPARGTIRFEFALARGPARLEVLDLAGRVVVTRALPAGAHTFTWNGRRDDGTRVRDGVYFARLRDGAGTVTRRLTWLGEGN